MEILENKVQTECTFISYLAALRPSLGHWQGSILSLPMLINGQVSNLNQGSPGGSILRVMCFSTYPKIKLGINFLNSCKQLGVFLKYSW